MELMFDMQQYGQPPAEIIKDLAPGLKFDENGMPIMPNMGSGEAVWTGTGGVVASAHSFPPLSPLASRLAHVGRNDARGYVYARRGRITRRGVVSRENGGRAVVAAPDMAAIGISEERGKKEEAAAGEAPAAE